MSEEIVKADPKKQRLLFLILTLGAALGIWSVLRLEDQLTTARSVSLNSVSSAAIQTLEIATSYFQAFGGLLALFGLYLAILGLRIWRSGTFPPPGAWVVRDTRVLRDGAARLRSITALVVGIALVVIGLSMPNWAEAQLNHVLQGAMQTPDTPPETFLPHVE